jgi:Short-chain dehydrogenases of various substrate specificities
MIPIDKNKFGPWALVTGASSGIGAEFARQLVASGLNVVLVARRLALLEELGRQLAERYRVAYRAIAADLSDESVFEERIAAATQDIDIGLLVSNAGAGNPSEFLSASLDDLHAVVRLNIAAHLNLLHHFAPKLVERGRGGVVLVSALGAAEGLPFMANDGATKAYILSLGEALHIEFEKLGIHTTVVLPGGVDTPVISKIGINPKTMPIKPISVEQCVNESLVALSRNQPTLVPGRMFRAMAALTPRAVMTRIFGSMLAKAVAARHTPSNTTS